METVGAIVLAYLVGSVPFALLVARRRGIDLRVAGSGNVGAANVLRTAGAGAAVAAMTLDALKGAAAVLVAQRLTSGAATPVAAGIAAMVGHVYPVWLRFHGGKGVATAVGVFVILTPLALAAASALFVVVVWLTRYISLGSVVAALVLPVLSVGTGSSVVVTIGSTLAAAIVVHRHRANLVRIVAGTERRVGQRFAEVPVDRSAGTPT
jgi:glycerol-3-phosphate acyltransferase PlsY